MAERIIKPWGWSQEVYRDELTRVVRIHVEPGGFCSWHEHERQVNVFQMLRGELTIHFEGGSSTIITDWNASHDAIEPLVPHRFHNESKLPAEALEIYTSTDGSPPDESDIVRFSEGGIEKP